MLTILLTFSICGCENSKSVKSEKAIKKCTLYITCINAINSEKLADNIRKFTWGWHNIRENRSVIYRGGILFRNFRKRIEKWRNTDWSSINAGKQKAYILEGINNLYEFDCGKQSGWMYTVNGDVPNVSCSEYKIKENDEIKFQYTCNLGEDIEKKWEKNSEDFDPVVNILFYAFILGITMFVNHPIMIFISFFICHGLFCNCIQKQKNKKVNRVIRIVYFCRADKPSFFS